MKLFTCKCGNKHTRPTCPDCMAVIKSKVKAGHLNFNSGHDSVAMPKYHTTSEAGCIGVISNDQMRRNTQAMSLKSITRGRRHA